MVVQVVCRYCGRPQAVTVDAILKELVYVCRYCGEKFTEKEVSCFA